MHGPRLSASYPGQGGANNDYWSSCQQVTSSLLVGGGGDGCPTARPPLRCATSPVSLAQLPPTPATAVPPMERHPSASCLSVGETLDGLASMDVFGLLDGPGEEARPGREAQHVSWQAQHAQQAQQAQQALLAQQQLLATQRAEQQRWCEAAAALLQRPQAGDAQRAQRHHDLALLLRRHEEEAGLWEQRRRREQQQWEGQRAEEQARWEARRAAEQEAWEARRRAQRREWEGLHAGAAGGVLDGPHRTASWLARTSAPEFSCGSLPRSLEGHGP